LVKVSSLTPAGFSDETIIKEWNDVLHGVRLMQRYDPSYYEQIRDEPLTLVKGKSCFIRMAYLVEDLVSTTMNFQDYMEWRQEDFDPYDDADDIANDDPALSESYSLDLRFEIAGQWLDETPLAVFGLPIHAGEAGDMFHLAMWLTRYPFHTTPYDVMRFDGDRYFVKDKEIFQALKTFDPLPEHIHIHGLIQELNRKKIYGFELGTLIQYALRITGDVFADVSMAELEVGGWDDGIDWANPDMVASVQDRQRRADALCSQFHDFAAWLDRNNEYAIDILLNIYGAAAVVLANDTQRPATLMELVNANDEVPQTI